MTVTRTHYLEVNGVPLATYAWDIPNLPVMFDSDALLGSDRLIPGGSAVGKPRRASITERTFTLHVHGHVDEDNVGYANPYDGLATNMQYLNENLGLAKSTGDGTVAVTWHRGSLNSFSGDAHFLGFRGAVQIARHTIRTVFTLSFPAALTEDTP